jgi:hypothetical protein
MGMNLLVVVCRAPAPLKEQKLHSCSLIFSADRRLAAPLSGMAAWHAFCSLQVSKDYAPGPSPPAEQDADQGRSSSFWLLSNQDKDNL